MPQGQTEKKNREEILGRFQMAGKEIINKSVKSYKSIFYDSARGSRMGHGKETSRCSSQKAYTLNIRH